MVEQSTSTRRRNEMRRNRSAQSGTTSSRLIAISGPGGFEFRVDTFDKEVFFIIYTPLSFSVSFEIVKTRVVDRQESVRSWEFGRFRSERGITVWGPGTVRCGK